MAAKTGNKHGHHWIADIRRLAIYLRDGLACYWCGAGVEVGAILTLDHLTPRSRGGGHQSDNLITACIGCNAARGNLTVAKWCVVADKIPREVRKHAQRKPEISVAREMLRIRGGLRAAVYHRLKSPPEPSTIPPEPSATDRR